MIHPNRLAGNTRSHLNLGLTVSKKIRWCWKIILIFSETSMTHAEMDWIFPIGWNLLCVGIVTGSRSPCGSGNKHLFRISTLVVLPPYIIANSVVKSE